MAPEHLQHLDLLSPARRGVLLTLAASFFAALFLIPYGAAVKLADRGSVVAAMLLSAAIFNTALALVRERQRILSGWDRLSLVSAALLAVGTVLGNSGVALALPDIGPGMTSTVLKAQVIITPALSLWFLKERPGGRLWAGGVLALLGFALPQAVAGEWAGSVGYLSAFIAAWGFAGMQVLTRRVVQRIRIAPVNALRLWVAVALLLALPTELGGGGLTLSREAWALAAAAGFLGPGLSRLCLMSAVRYISASRTALLAMVGPLMAFGFGYLFHRTVPTGLQAVGAVLILGGVLWPTLAAATGRAAAPPPPQPG
ncbi:MAG: DMT family transporter [Myxococcales bacterium]|nr:DMT family transporter [Myxococcales bacterium]